MNKYCFVLTGLLLLFQSMFALIGEPGGPGYELVIKPYPSVLKSIPNMEERGWAKSVESGDIPEWVVKKKYLAIAVGDFESKKQLWEYAYICLGLLTFGFVLLSSFLALSIFYRFSKKKIGKYLETKAA